MSNWEPELSGEMACLLDDPPQTLKERLMVHILCLLVLIIAAIPSSAVLLYSKAELESHTPVTAQKKAHLNTLIIKERASLDAKLAAIHESNYEITSRSPVMEDVYVLYSHIHELESMRSKSKRE